jgi:hypothetical protein
LPEAPSASDGSSDTENVGPTPVETPKASVSDDASGSGGAKGAQTVLILGCVVAVLVVIAIVVLVYLKCRKPPHGMLEETTEQMRVPLAEQSFPGI